MAKKPFNNNNYEDDMTSPDVKNAELAGKIEVVSSKLDDLSRNFSEKFGEINKKMDQQYAQFDHYVTKDEYKRHLDDATEKWNEVNPIITWVNDRKAVEKFLYGIIAFIGITNIILLVKIVFNL